jgi:hypothetical protein
MILGNRLGNVTGRRKRNGVLEGLEGRRDGRERREGKKGGRKGRKGGTSTSINFGK